MRSRKKRKLLMVILVKEDEIYNNIKEYRVVVIDYSNFEEFFYLVFDFF